MDPISIALGLAQAAPIVARWLGGEKAGKVADKVIGIAQAVTGKPTGEEALAAIKADPNLALEFQKAILANETELERLYLADRQDARARDVEMRKAGQNNMRADILAIGALIGLVALIWTLLFVSIPEGPARDVLLILSGALVTIVKDVYAFEFGSSRGSKDKDELLRKLGG